MGIIDDFLKAANGGKAPPAPAPAAASPPAPNPGYPEFLQRYIEAARAHGRANPGSLFNWLSGRQTDADVAAAEAAAPGAWQQLQSGQSAMQNAQLGTAQNIAQTGAMAGVPIDPNNIPASTADLYKAYASMFGPGGMFSNTAAAENPLQAQRAFYMRMGDMYSRMPQTLGIAKDFYARASEGIPANTSVLRDGSLADGANGQRISASVGDVKRSQEEPTARMEADYQRGTASHQAGLDRQTHTVNADTDAAHAIRTGIDTRTGLPVTTTDAALLRGGVQNFADKNPYFEGQQSELKDLRTKAENADHGLVLAQDIANAANRLYTGKGAGTLQDVRKFALAAAQLTGANVNDNVLNDTSQFEQLKFAAQQLVAIASHDVNSRPAQAIYNQIQTVKPGDTSSMRGLRDIITNQIVPMMMRNRAIYSGASNYYKTNPFKNDAMTVVPERTPLQNFRVKSYPEQINPGDYFISRHDGTLKQAPVN